MKILTKLKKFFNKEVIRELDSLMDEHLKLWEEHTSLQKAYIELQKEVTMLLEKQTYLYKEQTQLLKQNTALLINFITQSGAKHEGNLVFEGWDGERFMICEDGVILLIEPNEIENNSSSEESQASLKSTCNEYWYNCMKKIIKHEDRGVGNNDNTRV